MKTAPHHASLTPPQLDGLSGSTLWLQVTLWLAIADFCKKLAQGLDAVPQPLSCRLQWRQGGVLHVGNRATWGEHDACPAGRIQKNTEVIISRVIHYYLFNITRYFQAGQGVWGKTRHNLCSTCISAVFPCPCSFIPVFHPTRVQNLPITNLTPMAVSLQSLRESLSV